jgi:hypothetical protein
VTPTERRVRAEVSPSPRRGRQPERSRWPSTHHRSRQGHRATECRTADRRGYRRPSFQRRAFGRSPRSGTPVFQSRARI